MRFLENSFRNFFENLLGVLKMNPSKTFKYFRQVFSVIFPIMLFIVSPRFFPLEISSTVILQILPRVSPDYVFPESFFENTPTVPRVIWNTVQKLLGSFLGNSSNSSY